MKIRIMGLPEDLANFSNLLTQLESAGAIQIISASKPYPNRNSIEYRGYVELKAIQSDFNNIKKIDEQKIKVEDLLYPLPTYARVILYCSISGIRLYSGSVDSCLHDNRFLDCTVCEVENPERNVFEIYITNACQGCDKNDGTYC